uniref:Uncharacterized protein n=1 Tax=Desulfovibrio desulfuricans (strain ATCC 27774 / DSM 6949 / MB) TaxID=525146 RepID=B8J0T7_DESDA
MIDSGSQVAVGIFVIAGAALRCGVRAGGRDKIRAKSVEKVRSRHKLPIDLKLGNILLPERGIKVFNDNICAVIKTENKIVIAALKGALGCDEIQNDGGAGFCRYGNVAAGGRAA